jgi:lipoprotein-anchoring transpeptidase ErfK/SrfK
MVNKTLTMTMRFTMKLLVAGAALTLAPEFLFPQSPLPPAAGPQHSAEAEPAKPARSLVSPAAAATPQRPAFEIASPLALDREMAHGDYAWNDQGVPSGPTWVHVDLKNETIRVVRGNSEIGRAVILYGADDKPTPSGQFKITQKKRHHVSNLYNREMPYMLRLTNDGIAIHGSVVEYGYATHGCIGVPEEFAALLFREADLGDRVIISGT